jgi:membrane fusion protein (multidrug efflux system)
MQKKVFLMTGCIACVTLVAAAGLGCGKKKDATTGQEAAQSVAVAPVTTEPVERRIDITGTLAPWEEATVSIEVDGRLTEMLVDLGDQVKKGDVLCRIMPVEYEWKKTQAEADLLKAEADFKRVQKLHADNVVAKDQMDESNRKLDVARATADLARKKLADTVLRAPFDGAVAKRLVHPGEYIRAGAAAFYLVRLNPIKFKGDVPERYAGDVHKEDHVLAYTDAGRNISFPGTIARVGPSVASDSRSFAIEAEIDNSQGSIKPGSFARVSILTRKIDTMLTVPETAVTAFAGTPRVFVAKDGKAAERVIETAGKIRDRVLVVKGVKEGEPVIITGVELLSAGRAITIREDK